MLLSLTPAFQFLPQFMPIDRKRYPTNWEQIAKDVKDAAGWQCQHAQAKRKNVSPGQLSLW